MPHSGSGRKMARGFARVFGGVRTATGQQSRRPFHPGAAGYRQGTSVVRGDCAERDAGRGLSPSSPSIGPNWGAKCERHRELAAGNIMRGAGRDKLPIQQRLSRRICDRNSRSLCSGDKNRQQIRSGPRAFHTRFWPLRSIFCETMSTDAARRAAAEFGPDVVSAPRDGSRELGQTKFQRGKASRQLRGGALSWWRVDCVTYRSAAP
jgi:hypothetical protein